MTENTIKNESNVLADVGYVKLTKNTRGYGWEIKITAEKGSNVFDLTYLRAVDKKLRETYVEGIGDEDEEEDKEGD